MNNKNRVEYLVCTLCVLISGFIIYGLIAVQQPLLNGSKFQSFLLFGCLGGFGFSAIVSTIILSVFFFKKQGLALKMIASVLWPVTFGVCICAGVFLYIPYEIYNIMKIISFARMKQQKNSPEDVSTEK